jgi:hypothetical protein
VTITEEPVVMVEPAPPEHTPADEDLPDARLFWRWVWRSVRAYLGWVLVGAGAIFIAVGYLGVSREALVAKQIPYLVSGGIFGLGLIVLGTFYLYSEDMRRDSRRINRLERLVTELHAVLLTRAGAPDPNEISAAVARVESQFEERSSPFDAASGQNGQGVRTRSRVVLLALPDSHRFHRAGCRMVEGKPGATRVSVADIRERQLEPCGMCDPVVQIEV